MAHISPWVFVILIGVGIFIGWYLALLFASVGDE